jgi:hypothetical protein
MSNARPRRATSVARLPTTEDLTRETAELFANAGDDIPPIELGNPDEEIDRLLTALEPSANWDDQVSAMHRLMGLVNGGALSNDSFRRRISLLASGLGDAATNLRSALVKQSCLVIAQFARVLGSGFDQFGDFMNTLSTQLSHGTEIISESCKFAILAIAAHCPSRKIFLSLGDLAGKKGAPQKAVAAESFAIVFQTWPPESYSGVWQRVEPIVVKLVGDASPEVRTHARNAVRSLQASDHGKYDRIVASLDQRLRTELASPVSDSAKRPVKNADPPTQQLRPVASAPKPPPSAGSTGSKRS